MVFLTHAVVAQSDPTGKRKVTTTFAITNATVITAPGQAGIKSTVLFKDGVIAGIGSGITLPKETKVIPGDSLFIYPGFIDGAGSMGITKPKEAERPKDLVSSNPPDEFAGITPWRSAADQFSIGGNQVDDWRKTGFTITQALPDGGMLPGKAAILILGDGNSSNLIQNNSSLVANFRGSRNMYPATLAGVMAKFRDIYQNTALSLEHEKMYASTSGVKRPETTPTQSAMAPVVQKQIPVIFTASSDLEIRRALALQKELGFRLVLTGLENYEMVIDQIKTSGTPVLIKIQLPDDKAIKAHKSEGVTEATKAQMERVKEAYDKALIQASLLEKAGIPFAFSTANSKPGDAMKTVQTLIKNGLSEKAALAALTTNPASLLGISRVTGTVEKGKIANLIVSTGPIFAEDTQIKHVVVNGLIYDFEVKKKAAKEEAKSTGTTVASIEGVWEYTSETPAGSSGGEIVLKKDTGGWGGTISYDDPAGSGKVTAPIKNVTLNGKMLSFDFAVAAGGMSLNVTVSGEINGSSMEGSLSVPQMGSFPVKATLSSPSLSN